MGRMMRRSESLSVAEYVIECGLWLFGSDEEKRRSIPFRGHDTDTYALSDLGELSHRNRGWLLNELWKRTENGCVQYVEKLLKLGEGLVGWMGQCMIGELCVSLEWA